MESEDRKMTKTKNKIGVKEKPIGFKSENTHLTFFLKYNVNKWEKKKAQEVQELIS